MRTLVAVAAAAVSLPHFGALFPGRSLGGVHLDEPAAQVRATLGGHGVCVGCSTRTWYFTYGKFTQSGLAVELERGRVSAVYTIWQPVGWQGPNGLELGAVEAEVTRDAGPLIPIACPGYTALVRDEHGLRTAYYILDGKLWGFGLMRAQAIPCR